MDPISNMIVQIKNAGDVGHSNVLVPFSKIKFSIAQVLKQNGFVAETKEVMRKGKKFVSIDLVVENRVPRIKGVKRISKPSKRIYKKYSEIRPVKNGYGLLVLSTPKGVMGGYEAKKAHLGGEALFTIW